MEQSFLGKAIWKVKQLKNFKHLKITYSQEGEDLILKSILPEKGFYVDVGAHHPVRLSNTFLLYQKGWHGINIDVDERAINALDKYRPQDINICTAILDKEKLVTFNMYDDWAINNMDEKSSTNCRKLKIKSQTLETVFTKNNVKQIDFLNIDVEGAELLVLKGNNWGKWKPTVIAVEIFGLVKKSPINIFLEKQGYILTGKTTLTAIYKLAE